MTTSHDQGEVLRQWGDEELGAGNGGAGQGLCELILDIIRRQSGVTRVCDLGCGNGYLAWRLGQDGYTVTGVDASDRLLSIARANYGHERITFRQGLFGAGSAEDLAGVGLCDLVVSVDVVEHLYRPASLIETADAILKPGGTLVICTPYHGYVKNLALSILGRWDDHHGVHFDGGHIKFFSVTTLKALIGNAFEPQQMHFYGRFPGLWKNMICVARKRG